jgi:hypothetical protein
VNYDDRHFIRKILESVANRIASFSAADGQQKSFRVTLKKPWRRVTHMFVRENYDNHRDVVALLKCLNAVEQHRLARDPAELLELLPASAGSLPAGDDHNADVTHH